ncbi:MAG: hypothetical protein KBD97_06425, partial [Bacteroidaceae bacterium]|nr:hypothetical protein [Bacteroidaceae bacterium]
MIKKLVSITIVFFFYLLIGENAQAQSLQIQTSSQIGGLNLLSLQKMSFSEGNLVIVKTNGAAQNYALSTIQKLYFADSTTPVNAVT